MSKTNVRVYLNRKEKELLDKMRSHNSLTHPLWDRWESQLLLVREAKKELFGEEKQNGKS